MGSISVPQVFVVGFMFSPDRSQLLLIEKQRPSWQAGRLNGIGGKMEAGETPSDALVREFFEETGVSTRPEVWVHFAELHKEFELVHFFAAVTEDFFDATTLTDEIVERCDVAKLPTRALPDLSWLIPLALEDRCEVVEVRYVHFDAR